MRKFYLILPIILVFTGAMCSTTEEIYEYRAEEEPTNQSTNEQSMDLTGYETTESGLQVKDEVVGDGQVAKEGDAVEVHYTGTFMDGEKFDSSVDRGTPFQFVLGQGMVIAGWDEGVKGMKIGGKRWLIVPPELGYGMNDFGPIPGGSTLVFEVELLEIGA